ncbi:MAG: hypothetical protein FWH06_05890, partial [Oscillospiraceae bacterium]|nr:hypothetical protein [Oscillospiraceae bacterium]
MDTNRLFLKTAALTLTLAAAFTFGRMQVISLATGIDYTSPDVVVTGDKEGFAAADTSTFEINLTKGTITLPRHSEYPVKAYSIDGGGKWVKAKPFMFSAANFGRLLSKDLELWLTDDFDARAKKPGTGARTVKFAKIYKSIPFPAFSADYNGTSWTLKDKDNNPLLLSDYDNIEVSEAGSIELEWGAFDTSGGSILPITANPDTLYYVRYKPKTDPAVAGSGTRYIAPSAPVKITIKGERTAKGYKIDYSTETIKLKKGDFIYAGGRAGVPDDEGDATPVSAAEWTLQAGEFLEITADKG